MRSKTYFTPISFFHFFFLDEHELGMTFPLVASGFFVWFFLHNPQRYFDYKPVEATVSIR